MKQLYFLSYHQIKHRLEGIKQSKERLSIAFIVNALGTEFIKPIIIGHHRKPR